MSGKRRPQETRNRIIGGASEVFAAVGYGDAALSAITRAAGVTKGALYFHFRSKEDLAAAVIVEQHELCMTEALRAVESVDSPLQALRLTTRRFAELLMDDVVVRAGIRLTFEASVLSLDIAGPYDAWQQRCRLLAERAVAAGELRESLDVEAFARFVVSAFTGVQLVSEVLSGRDDLLVRVDQFWDFLLGRQTPLTR